MATLEQNKVHIFDIGRGALMEEVSVQLEKVAENLYDPNTSHKPVRKLTVELEFSIDEHRELVNVSASTKIKTVPSKPVQTRLTFGKERNGWGATEITTQVPGQMGLDGLTEPAQPFIVVGHDKTVATENTPDTERKENHA